MNERITYKLFLMQKMESENKITYDYLLFCSSLLHSAVQISREDLGHLIGIQDKFNLSN